MAIESFLRAQRGQTFSYAEVGASRGESPPGYTVDHNRALLGSGVETYGRAVAAIRSWQMFNLGWCRPARLDAPIEAGTTVAIVIRHFGFWSLNACRIVYVIEEQGAVRRYGFAYGTLPSHGEVGEERFSVELRPDDESVWYDLYAFSRPGAVLARLGYPLGRMLQRRFAVDSKRAMVEAVRASRS
ncbi:MAG TPA: DUF1990 domain-containing protein [Pyrinomonadaceae bacterium]|nr:DUF1990 domain-containing protein [Pyrinomonadaceae bacterium]